jgi:hypothetical protein
LRGVGLLKRAELVEGIKRRGVGIAPHSQAGYPSSHLVRRAALGGIVCFGRTATAETYVLSSDWGVPGYRGAREDALEELVRRYLAAY